MEVRQPSPAARMSLWEDAAAGSASLFTTNTLSPIFPARMLSIFINFLLVIHILVSLLIVLVVLMQRPKSEGLGAAFGGGMTDNLFGAQTTNVLQGFTRWLGGLFFGLTLLLSILYARQSVSESSVQKRLKNAAPPAAAAAA